MPLMPHVGIRGWVTNGKTDDKDIGLGVGKRSQSVVFLLAGCVPQVQADDLAVHRRLGAVVVKDSGDVLLRKGVRRVTDEEAGFADSPIPYDHTFDRLHPSLGVRGLLEGRLQ